MSCGLTPDASVPDHDCWYRVLTNNDHITRDGTVHYQALKRQAFRPPKDQKPWAHELSGRLVSLVDDIVGEAEAQIVKIHANFARKNKPIPSKIRFVGIACATAAEIRAATLPVITIDVVYSPLPTDTAHANIVTYQTNSDEDLDPVRDWLRETFHVIEPQDINLRITSCG